MTDDSRRQPFKNFGDENERNSVGFYVVIGLAIIVVLAFVTPDPEVSGTYAVLYLSIHIDHL